MNFTTFKHILKQLRKESDLTQRDLAKELSVSSSTIAMWETGKRLPSPEYYEQIADFFNVDIDYLYGRSDIRQKVRFDPDGNMQVTLSPDQDELLSYYDQLNSEGKAEALKQVSNLAKIKDYREDTPSSKGKMA